jgi:hypothetical protein
VKSLVFIKKTALMQIDKTNHHEALQIEDVRQDFQKKLTIEVVKPLLYVPKILATNRLLRERISVPITFSTPLISLNGGGIIFQRTINLIQGQTGVHKSRIASMFASMLLHQDKEQINFLGFKRESEVSSAICYVDTERNLTEQLPFAFQCIQKMAGYDEYATDVPGFYFCSLVEFKREDRFAALAEYLEYVRRDFSGHIFIFLDIVTDCIRDFNRSEDSMLIIDMMNQAINTYDVTFLALIHENPGQQKARGHLGTELSNKATTIIQLSFESDGENNASEIIRIKFNKTRNTKIPAPIFARLDDPSGFLTLADSKSVSELRDSRREKMPITDMADFFENLPIYATYTRKELYDLLNKQFGISIKTLDRRLAELSDRECTFFIDGKECRLTEERSKEISYTITPLIEDEDLPIQS